MAEHSNPPPATSQPFHSDDEDDGPFYRDPEPVPAAADFFNRSAVAFNPASMNLKENEHGLLVSADNSEDEEDLASDLSHQDARADATIELEDEDESMEEPVVSKGKEVQDRTPSTMFSKPLLDSGASKNADQRKHTSTVRVSPRTNLQDLTNPTSSTTTSTHTTFSQSDRPSIFTTTSTSHASDKSSLDSRIAELGDKEEAKDEERQQEAATTEESQEIAQVKAATPITLFPVSQPDRGLVLATKEQGEDDQHVSDAEEEEEDIPVRYPSLSELSHSRSSLKAPRRTFEPSASAAIPTLVESTNVKRWDLEKDEELSDAEIDLEFANQASKDSKDSKALNASQTSQDSEISKDSQGSQSPALTVPAQTQAVAESRVSPFAAFLEQPSDILNGILNGRQGASAHSDDGTDNDIKEYAGVAIAAGSALLARKFLHGKDSEDEKDAGDVDLASLLREPLTKLLGVQPKESTSSQRNSSSDDGMPFIGGVGSAIKAVLDASLQNQSRASSDHDADETSTPKYTAAEKGKQVVRDGQPAAAVQRELLDDLPPFNSLADMGFGTIGKAPVPGMLSPTPVSLPAPASVGPRTGIYPAAPPGPWAPGSLRNSLSQRRSPVTNVRTDSTDTKDAFNHDPNLAFAVLPRKQPAAAQPKPAEGVRSLLSDYPDDKPKAAAQKTVTLPADPSKAPVLRGRYELPSINKIDQWKSKNSLAPNAFRRLVFNVLALIISSRVMKGRIYRSLVKLVSTVVNPSIIYWTEWAVIVVLLFNIAEVIYSYTRRANHFENLPLTPSQRALLGLEPIASKAPGAVPVFKKSVVAPHNLTERPIMSTYVSPSQASLASSRTPFQKPAVALVASEYRDAATILNKSMARSFNTVSVQDRAGVERLMRNVEAREELKAEWKGVDNDPTKRAFGLHSTFGTPQGNLQGGMDITDHNSRPDLLASLNSRGPVSRYQPALRTTLSKDHTSKTDLQKDGIYQYGHTKVLKSLKLSEDQLDRWVFNLRKWLWNKIVKHVCSEMEEVDAEFTKQGLSYLDCKSATMFYTSGPLPQNATANGNAASTTAAPAAPAAPLTNSLGWGAASIANPRAPSAFGPAITQPQQPQLPTSLQDLDARYGQLPIVRRRMILELYLAIPGFANRKFVVERLQAMGPLLSHFSWDSANVTWENGKKPWSQDLPTDSQIIMHLFTVFMDLAMPAQPSQSFDRFPFSYKHYVPMESKPDATTSLQIKQTAKYPPNYNLVVDGGMWEVVPKRLNVWYTLVLFIYMVMKEHGGYIGQINIGTRAIGLGDVVEGFDN
ncbi:hypothetical protein BGX29_008547 [Mortierella sp. GBA35]|nr:hypothetical protein BGX29_008547 [Mortierella sp. GBA35]